MRNVVVHTPGRPATCLHVCQNENRFRVVGTPPRARSFNVALREVVSEGMVTIETQTRVLPFFLKPKPPQSQGHGWVLESSVDNIPIAPSSTQWGYIRVDRWFHLPQPAPKRSLPRPWVHALVGGSGRATLHVDTSPQATYLSVSTPEGPFPLVLTLPTFKTLSDSLSTQLSRNVGRGTRGCFRTVALRKWTQTVKEASAPFAPAGISCWELSGQSPDSPDAREEIERWAGMEVLSATASERWAEQKGWWTSPAGAPFRRAAILATDPRWRACA